MKKEQLNIFGYLEFTEEEVKLILEAIKLAKLKYFSNNEKHRKLVILDTKIKTHY